MVALEPGLVVLVRFPFSDLSSSKLRPAVVLAQAGGVDWILCQVTSNPYGARPQYWLRVGEVRVFYDVVGNEVQVLAVVEKARASEWLDAWGEPNEEGSSV